MLQPGLGSLTCTILQHIVSWNRFFVAKIQPSDDAAEALLHIYSIKNIHRLTTFHVKPSLGAVVAAKGFLKEGKELNSPLVFLKRQPSCNYFSLAQQSIDKANCALQMFRSLRPLRVSEHLRFADTLVIFQNFHSLPFTSPSSIHVHIHCFLSHFEPTKACHVA